MQAHLYLSNMYAHVYLSNMQAHVYLPNMQAHVYLSNIQNVQLRFPCKGDLQIYAEEAGKTINRIISY